MKIKIPIYRDVWMDNGLNWGATRSVVCKFLSLILSRMSQS